jgi:hypothetical protein
VKTVEKQVAVSSTIDRTIVPMSASPKANLAVVTSTCQGLVRSATSSEIAGNERREKTRE